MGERLGSSDRKGRRTLIVAWTMVVLSMILIVLLTVGHIP